MNTVAENICHVENNISSSCQKAGRDPKEVTLIAVSKTKPVSALMEAYQCGCRHFGENKFKSWWINMNSCPKILNGI